VILWFRDLVDDMLAALAIGGETLLHDVREKEKPENAIPAGENASMNRCWLHS